MLILKRERENMNVTINNNIKNLYILDERDRIF